MALPYVQLEAFRDIAKFRGVSNAARARGKSISTYSERLSELEAAVGTRLCDRDRFRLLRAGRQLARGIDAGLTQLKTAFDAACREAHQLAPFATVEVVAEYFMPGLTQRLEQLHPTLRCTTISGTEEELARLWREREVDFVIIPGEEPWKGGRRVLLAEVMLALVCRRDCGVRTLGEVFRHAKIPYPLFVSSVSDTVLHCLVRGLAALHASWPDRRTVSTALAVNRHVLAQGGFGLTVNLRHLTDHPDLQFLPLTHFPRVPIYAYHRGPLNKIHREAVAVLREFAAELARGAR